MQVNLLSDDMAQTCVPPKNISYTHDSLEQALQVCSICMSTTAIRTFPDCARAWLTSVTNGPICALGLCALCVPLLRRSLRMWERAQKTQEALRTLLERGELNVSQIPHFLSSIESEPLVKLTVKKIEPNECIYFNDEESNLIKTESIFYDNYQISDGDNDNSDVDSDVPLKVIKKSDNDNVKHSDTESDVPLKAVRNSIDSDVGISKSIDSSDTDSLIGESVKKTDDVIKKDCLAAELSRLLKKKLRKEPIKRPKDEKILKHFDLELYSVEEQKAEMMKRRMNTEYEKADFKCVLCYQGFMDEKEFDCHVAQHPKDGLTCAVCLKRCSTRAGFALHIRAHLERWVFSCKSCAFRTTIVSNAKLHGAMHDGKKYECTTCGHNFSKHKSWLTHLRIKHPSDHVCGLCGYSFLGERGVYCHRYLKHKGEDQTIPEDGPYCTECDIRFKTETALATHRRVSPKHGQNGYNAARKTRPTNSTRRRLATAPCDYRRERDPNETIYCEQCGLALRGPHAYRYHFQRAHPSCARTVFFERTERSLCTVCGTSVANLYSHMQTHREGAVRCVDCGKLFRTRQAMQIHRAVHREPRHACPTCGKRFNQRANLNRHFTYTHTTARDFKCEYCGKFYKSAAERTSHTNFVHLKKPWPRKRESAKGRGRSAVGNIADNAI